MSANRRLRRSFARPTRSYSGRPIAFNAAVPRLLFKDGFSVRMYDHPPPHVHVKLDSSEVRIELGTISLTHVYGMKKKSVAKAKQLVRENRDFLLQKWVEMHGPTII
jgi:hypothetical protein